MLAQHGWHAPKNRLTNMDILITDY